MRRKRRRKKKKGKKRRRCEGRGGEKRRERKEDDKKKEVDHVQTALKANDYESWALNIPAKKDKPPSQQHRKDSTTRPTIGLPYIRGLSETLGRIFRQHGVTSYHKPINTLKNNLVRPKDRTIKEKKSGAIYLIKCETCSKEYIGETSRPLGKRLDEHRRLTSSAIREHMDTTGHTIDWQNVKILEREQHDMKRKIKEAIHIRKRKPALNRDLGIDLPPIYQPFWSCVALTHDQTVKHQHPEF